MTPHQHQQQLKNQIFGSYTNTETKSRFTKSESESLNEMIKKGEISDTLASGYGAGSKPFVFTKTGKEIKDKVPSILASLEVQKVTLEAQLTALQAAAGIVPTRENSRRYSKTSAFLRYEYSLCEPEYLGNNQYATKTDQMDACNKYNSLVYLYNDILDDIDSINVITTNVEDSKKYDLSVSQLIALSFK
jgi:hypothetical protein